MPESQFGFQCKQNAGILLGTNYPMNAYHCKDQLQDRHHFSECYGKEWEGTEVAVRWEQLHICSLLRKSYCSPRTVSVLVVDLYELIVESKKL